jgi:uncharacterized membrane protein
MKSKIIIKKLRFVAGAALIGCVTAGAFLGWLDLNFDPRIAGTAIGAIYGAIKFHLFV